MSKVMEHKKADFARPSKRNARISLKRRSSLPVNPNRRNMSVDVSETFEEVHEMNKKALHLLAKRA